MGWWRGWAGPQVLLRGVRNGRGIVQAELRKAFRAAREEPDSVRTETVPNRHDPAVTDAVVGQKHAHRAPSSGSLAAKGGATCSSM